MEMVCSEFTLAEVENPFLQSVLYKEGLGSGQWFVVQLQITRLFLQEIGVGQFLGLSWKYAL